jgi:hypothetical protein
VKSTEYRIQARTRASGSRSLVHMICLVFVFKFVFVTGLRSFFGYLVLWVPFTPYDLSRQSGIHIPHLNPFINSGKMSVGGCACVCLMLVEAWRMVLYLQPCIALLKSILLKKREARGMTLIDLGIHQSLNRLQLEVRCTRSTIREVGTVTGFGSSKHRTEVSWCKSELVLIRSGKREA